jgi:hypothetical protein
MYGSTVCCFVFTTEAQHAGGGEDSMMVSRFTKAFQLIALVLAFSVAQVYVMAGPIKASHDSRTPNTSSANEPKTETAADTSGNKLATATASSENQSAPEAAAEKMTLRVGSKTALNRLFSKSDIEARVASGNTFLKANTSAAAMFKTTSKPASSQTGGSSDDSDDTGRRGTWIAVGVIAVVLTIAVIALRHDRSHPDQGQ